ncbi:MAG: branched-chain amino acid transaminase [Calditrichaeota bacterium]|nr:branched-chain amino acid transaminase [Calditrichota bacterium]
MATNKGNAQRIWHNGNFINWEDAKIHVMSHVVHYGTAVFEGIRCYKTRKGSAIFRLPEHVKRLFNSAKIYRMVPPDFTYDQIFQACIDSVKVNNFDDCYIRPVIFRGLGEFGVNPLKSPVETYIITWHWGKYLGPDALENGVEVQIASWNRFSPNTLPALAKAGANYMNSQLIKMEALQHGYIEGIALDTYGFVSEGSGENIFIVKDGEIFTPPISASVLPGITRDSIIRLSREMGLNVHEEMIPREILYIADEVFFTGTAAEITPISCIDKIDVGNGKRGSITKKLQDEFFGIISGEKEDRFGWLEYLD